MIGGAKVSGGISGVSSYRDDKPDLSCCGIGAPLWRVPYDSRERSVYLDYVDSHVRVAQCVADSLAASDSDKLRRLTYCSRMSEFENIVHA